VRLHDVEKGALKSATSGIEKEMNKAKTGRRVYEYTEDGDVVR